MHPSNGTDETTKLANYTIPYGRYLWCFSYFLRTDKLKSFFFPFCIVAILFNALTWFLPTQFSKAASIDRRLVNHDYDHDDNNKVVDEDDDEDAKVKSALITYKIYSA